MNTRKVWYRLKRVITTPLINWRNLTVCWLAETGWFQSAIVTLILQRQWADNGDYLTMDASFTRAQNFVELGAAAFTTDVGPRVQAKWNKPWVEFQRPRPDLPVSACPRRNRLLIPLTASR